MGSEKHPKRVLGKVKAEMRHCCKPENVESHGGVGGSWNGFSSTASEGHSHCLDCDPELISRGAWQKSLLKPLLPCAEAAPCRQMPNVFCSSLSYETPQKAFGHLHRVQRDAGAEDPWLECRGGSCCVDRARLTPLCIHFCTLISSWVPPNKPFHFLIPHPVDPGL